MIYESDVFILRMEVGVSRPYHFEMAKVKEPLSSFSRSGQAAQA
jgi:hypothetical protein